MKTENKNREFLPIRVTASKIFEAARPPTLYGCVSVLMSPKGRKGHWANQVFLHLKKEVFNNKYLAEATGFPCAGLFREKAVIPELFGLAQHTQKQMAEAETDIDF